MKRCVRIYVEYSDGTAEDAYGDDANQIWEFIEGATAMCQIHGAAYKGPHLMPCDLIGGSHV